MLFWGLPGVRVPNVAAWFSKYDFWILWNFLDRYSKKYFRKIISWKYFSMKIFFGLDFFWKKIFFLKSKKFANFYIVFWKFLVEKITKKSKKMLESVAWENRKTAFWWKLQKHPPQKWHENIAKPLFDENWQKSSKKVAWENRKSDPCENVKNAAPSQ